MPLIASVVGNRPQFVKAAPILRALAGRADVVTIDTGQHYDDDLRAVFYDDLGLDPPAHALAVGSGTHGQTTARILERIEPILARDPYDWVVVYGDTDSTLAATLAAAKVQRPVAHVEAGLRSFDRSMPEELNRIVADTLADLRLAPSDTAVENLAAEGITTGVELVGDVMVDAAATFGPLADARASIVEQLGVARGGYVVVTVHRAANTEPGALAQIVDLVNGIPDPVVLPLHPRTAAALARDGLAFGPTVSTIGPLGYLDFTALLRAARRIVTDSGGVQKEAYLHGVPCITLRDETEWVETVAHGWNTLAGSDPTRLADALAAPVPDRPRPPVYGDGHAAERIAALLT